MSKPYLPLWAQYVQAFGTLSAAVTAAAIASAIQFRQWKVASDKLRLDLFDKRLKVVAAFDRSIWLVGPANDKGASKKEVEERLLNLDGYRYLFDTKTVSLISHLEDALLNMHLSCLGFTHDKSDQEQSKWEKNLKIFEEKRIIAHSRCAQKITFAR